jgi:hypothetical protein
MAVSAWAFEGLPLFVGGADGDPQDIFQADSISHGELHDVSQSFRQPV